MALERFKKWAYQNTFIKWLMNTKIIHWILGLSFIKYILDSYTFKYILDGILHYTATLFHDLGFKLVLGVGIGSIAGFIADKKEWIWFLSFMIALDYFTGVAKRISLKIVSSRVASKGLIKIIVWAAILYIGYLISDWIGPITVFNFELQPFIFEGLCLFMIGNEFISLLENLELMGITTFRPLRRLISTYIEDNVRKLTDRFIGNNFDYEKDFDNIRNNLLPLLENDYYKTFYALDAKGLQKVVCDLNHEDNTDLETFKARVKQYMKAQKDVLVDQIEKSTAPKAFKDYYMKGHNKCLRAFLYEIDLIDTEDREYIKKVISQMVIRHLNTGVGDGLSSDRNKNFKDYIS